MDTPKEHPDYYLPRVGEPEKIDSPELPDVDYTKPMPEGKNTRPILKDGKPIGVVWCDRGIGPTDPLDTAPLGIQVGGGHYKDMKIQPIEFIHANNLGYAEGCVVKYVSRWKKKNGIEDLRKAKHFIDLLIDLEGAEDDRLSID